MIRWNRVPTLHHSAAPTYYRKEKTFFKPFMHLDKIKSLSSSRREQRERKWRSFGNASVCIHDIFFMHISLNRVRLIKTLLLIFTCQSSTDMDRLAVLLRIGGEKVGGFWSQKDVCEESTTSTWYLTLRNGKARRGRGHLLERKPWKRREEIREHKLAWKDLRLKPLHMGIWTQVSPLRSSCSI